jgi:hypothetical protein
MRAITLDNLLPPAMLRDLKFSFSKVPAGGKIRLFRIPVVDFYAAINATLQKFGPIPFRPLVLGIPIDMTANPLPEVVVVHDDDTNIAQNPIREEPV